MGYIDLNNLDALTPEMRKQTEMLLEQFPQLKTGVPIPQKEEQKPAPLRSDENTLDYAAFDPQVINTPPQPSTTRLKPLEIKIDPKKSSFSEIGSDNEDGAKTSAEEKPPREKNEFSPIGKMHPVLSKMRATLGMLSPKRTYEVGIGGVKYRLEALDNANLTRALVMAVMSSLSDAEYRMNADLGQIAWACTHIDGVPLEDVFEIPRVSEVEKDANGNPRKLFDHEIKQAASTLFYNFIKSSPPQFGEALLQYYRQEFPPLDLLEKGMEHAYCPAENCDYSRIINPETKCFCPYHGEELTHEGSLPNP